MISQILRQSALLLQKTVRTLKPSFYHRTCRVDTDDSTGQFFKTLKLESWTAGCLRVHSLCLVLRERRAALISAYVLKSVMDYDEFCGGEAEFITMKNNGEIGYQADKAIPLYPCTEFPGQILKAMSRMLRKLTHAARPMD